jgi:hypothetical protein
LAIAGPLVESPSLGLPSELFGKTVLNIFTGGHMTLVVCLLTALFRRCDAMQRRRDGKTDYTSIVTQSFEPCGC